MEGATQQPDQQQQQPGGLDCPPQLTREYSCPYIYLRVQLRIQDSSVGLTDKLFKAVLREAVEQFLGKTNTTRCDVLHVQDPQTAEYGSSIDGLVGTRKGCVEKLSAACACCSTYGELPIQLSVIAAASCLGQLAVSSRSFMLQHCMPLLARQAAQ